MARTELEAGIDEAGRGPLAGPVVAAAVIMDPGQPIRGIRDSKRLAPARREILAREIEKRALAWAVGVSEPAEIDALNILQASLLAMKRAVAGLAPHRPVRVYVDGDRAPELACPVVTVVGGDATVTAIGAASILAKVHRDQEMRRLDACFPGYGLARHKGYGTAAHLEALRLYGPCACHRRSFRPVQASLQYQETGQ